MSIVDEILMCVGSWCIGFAMAWGPTDPVERLATYDNNRCLNAVGCIVFAAGLLLALLGPEH